MLDLLINESPTGTEIERSLAGFVNRVKRYLSRLGVGQVSHDEERLVAAHEIAMRVLHRYINPSCFKAAAALSLSIAATRPFDVELPSTFRENALQPNAVFGILEAVYWMHDSELQVAPDDTRILSRPICFSNHFFHDLVAVVGIVGAATDFDAADTSPDVHAKLRLVSLVFEALAYQQNEHCKYPPPTELQLDKYFHNLP